MATVSGIFLYQGLPVNGATARLYPSGSFVSAPEKNTALPASGLLQTATTGTSHGGDGAYRFTGVSEGTYYVAVSYAGAIVYDSHTVQANPTANVKAYGAIGDGTTNDTTAIQTAIADTAVNRIFFPPGTYLCGNLTISRDNLILEGEGAILKWTGTAGAGNQIGIQLSGSVTNVTVQQLRFLGDGVAANGHAALWCNPGLTLTDIYFLNNYVASCAVGVSLDCSTSGSLGYVVIRDNLFTAMTGTGSGQGTAIYLAGGTSAASCVVSGNGINASQRHGIHLDRLLGATVSDNHISNHRTGVATGLIVPALMMEQVQDIGVTGNTFAAYNDGAINLTPVASATVDTRNVRITNNSFRLAANGVECVYIGHGTPSTGGVLEEVLIQGNNFYKTGVNFATLRLNSGKRIRVDNNVFAVLAVASLTMAIRLRGDGESGASATYSDEFEVTNNTFYGTTSGGSFVATSQTSTFRQSAVRAAFLGNRVIGGNFFQADSGDVTNANLTYAGQDLSGLSYGTTVVPLALYSGTTISLRAMRSSSSSPITVADTDDIVIGSTGGGAITANLPTAVGRRGKSFTFKRSGANNLVVDGSGAETIDGAATKTLSTDLALLQIVSDGAGWLITGADGTIT